MPPFQVETMKRIYLDPMEDKEEMDEYGYSDRPWRSKRARKHDEQKYLDEQKGVETGLNCREPLE